MLRGVEGSAVLKGLKPQNPLRLKVYTCCQAKHACLATLALSLSAGGSATSHIGRHHGVCGHGAERK